MKKAKVFLEQWLLDSRSWVAVLFVVGLFTLDLPFHDDHQWRQSITAVIARNFYEVNFNPFFPLYDICEEHSPDYFVTEFPLHASLSALGYYLFGEQFWIGRLIAWVTTCLGLWYFSRLVDRLLGAPVGLYAMVCLAGSIALTFGRKLMPDAFSVFLALIGTFQLYVFLEEGQRRNLLWGTLWISLGVLSKVPAVVIVCLLGVAYLQGNIPLKRKVLVSIGLALTALLTAGWYFAWMPYLQSITHCPPLIYPVSLREGWDILISERLSDTFYRFEWNAFYGRVQFYLFLLGVLWVIWGQKWRLLLASLAYGGVFFLFILKTGDIFATHTYYVIPFIPLMALYIGYLLRQKWLHPLLGLLIALGLSVVPLRKTYQDIWLFPELPELKLAGLLDGVGAERDDLIMINGGWGNPRYMYYSKRRGWTVNNNIMLRHDWMPDFRKEGVRFLVVIRSRYPEALNYPLIAQTQDFRIYDLRLPDAEKKR